MLMLTVGRKALYVRSPRRATRALFPFRHASLRLLFRGGTVPGIGCTCSTSSVRFRPGATGLDMMFLGCWRWVLMPRVLFPGPDDGARLVISRCVHGTALGAPHPALLIAFRSLAGKAWDIKMAPQAIDCAASWTT